MHEMTQNDANQLNILCNNLYIMSSWIIGITYTFNTTEEKKWYWKNMNVVSRRFLQCTLKSWMKRLQKYLQCTNMLHWVYRHWQITNNSMIYNLIFNVTIPAFIFSQIRHKSNNVLLIPIRICAMRTYLVVIRDVQSVSCYSLFSI